MSGMRADCDSRVGSLPAQTERRRSGVVIDAPMAKGANSRMSFVAVGAGNTNLAAEPVRAMADGAAGRSAALDNLAVKIGRALVHPTGGMSAGQGRYGFLVAASR